FAERRPLQSIPKHRIVPIRVPNKVGQELLAEGLVEPQEQVPALSDEETHSMAFAVMALANCQDDAGAGANQRIGMSGEHFQPGKILSRNVLLIEKMPHLVKAVAPVALRARQFLALLADMIAMASPAELLVRPVAIADVTVMTHGTPLFPFDRRGRLAGNV